jgi:hypothetical protein
MNSTIRRLETLERRARKPVRVCDALRILLLGGPSTHADKTLVLRCAETSTAIRALLGDDDEPQAA